MNLTALPLADPVPDSTIDKLIVEPLMAAPPCPGVVLDLDRPRLWRWLASHSAPSRSRQGFLRLVESRERKCAFLREVIRSLGTWPHQSGLRPLRSAHSRETDRSADHSGRSPRRRVSLQPIAVVGIPSSAGISRCASAARCRRSSFLDAAAGKDPLPRRIVSPYLSGAA